MKYTKLISRLMTIALINISTHSCIASDNLKEEFKGNWTGKFRLIDGSVVEHDPNRTTLGFISAGQGVYMKVKSYNGYPVSPEGIQLKTNSTQEEFIEALKKSGLYK